ncbi:hypothetical protein AALP_AA3G014900 [Arabis alpina]|uniref:KIB1-4 beta-propeller domain-containing protein n=1 Tax=Arabis alpina TaxID=50452 RepID=A0A087H6C9_ARAAL|nr:hypothetical protein AALP_AA3G014900 [Arabis alpina]
MSLLLSRISRLRLGKPLFVTRSSLLLLPPPPLSNAFSSSSSPLQTPPCSIFRGDPCEEADLIKLSIWDATQTRVIKLDKKVPFELITDRGTIGASNGWVATLKDDGILRLQDDFIPAASDTDPKRIPLPPLVTLPRCQTRIVTNVSMSTSSPEDEDCVVAVKFLGPQLSFCRPAQSNPEWTNIRIESPDFDSSRVMFSKMDHMFRMAGSGGHLIGSWDLCRNITKARLRKLRYTNLPELSKYTRDSLTSCSTSEHLVESITTGETFLVKWYKKAAQVFDGITKMGTEAIMVFKLGKPGNAVYTEDIGDLVIFLSRSEPFCVPASSFPGMRSNFVRYSDFEEFGFINLAGEPCLRAAYCDTESEKMVPLELVYPRHHSDDALRTIGASHGWIATLRMDDGILRLQDDLNPAASETDPKRIPLPPLVTLPFCQTNIVTNVSMSTSSPEDEDCVVAVKFLGPQLSFCRPAQSNPEWTNIRTDGSCFHYSRVMFSKRDDMFRIPGSGGHLIGSWDLCKDITQPTFQSLKFQNIPELTKAKRELMDSCCTTEHLVESTTTAETFLVKLFRKTGEIIDGVARMKTHELMVFKLDEEGNAVYTEDIGDLCIFISRSEPFCVPASSFPGMYSNFVNIVDSEEIAFIHIDGKPYMSSSSAGEFFSPYHIPPQDIIDKY